MYLKFLIVSQVLVVLVLVNNSTQWCTPCYTFTCPELNCTGGKVPGMCGCCKVCAKQLGEDCGGLYGTIGTCDKGLDCVLPPQYVNETIEIIYLVGVCKGKSNIQTEVLTPSGKTTAANEALTEPDGVVSVSSTLKPETSSVQQVKPTPGPDTTTQSAKITGGNEALTGSAVVVSVGSTLKSESPSEGKIPAGHGTLAQAVALNSENTTTDPRLQNGVSGFTRTKGVHVLCLVVFLCVLSLSK